MVERLSSKNKITRLRDREEFDEIDISRKSDVYLDSGFVEREQLSTLISSNRRPPKVNISTADSPHEAITGTLSPEGLGLLGGTRGDVLAFQVAELSLRLSSLDLAAMTEGQLRGVTAVNRLARMFEHLHILKTTQPEQ
jgi:hypothetical protein